MSQALLNALDEDNTAPRLDADGADAFAAANDGPLGVLFFTGDPVKKLETGDVAVVLRELVSQHPGRLRAGMVAPEAEKACMDKFGVYTLPALALVRSGEVLEVIPKIQDWSVYAEKIPAALDRVGA